MRDPGYRPTPSPNDPNDPDSWPTSGLFAPHDHPG
jgi:hypothetical protein